MSNEKEDLMQPTHRFYMVDDPRNGIVRWVWSPINDGTDDPLGKVTIEMRGSKRDSWDTWTDPKFPAMTLSEATEFAENQGFKTVTKVKIPAEPQAA